MLKVSRKNAEKTGLVREGVVCTRVHHLIDGLETCPETPQHSDPLNSQELEGSSGNVDWPVVTSELR